MTEDKIVVTEACKKFKETAALADVSVRFEQGKIHGIIGRNGSGKTVLFKCICGFMRLDSGSITIGGSPVKPGLPQEMGIIIEKPGFIGSYSGWKNLWLLARIRQKANRADVIDALRQVGLDPQSKKAVAKYSQGMKQRLGLAQAIMEKPDLLLLDEPMNGLDKHGVDDIRRLLKALNRSGVTIVLSSHYAEDIEALCDTVREMDGGRIRQMSGFA
jgi:ABC-2 type transport system ATP-binding protein